MARIRQGAGVALAALQLRIGHDFRQVAPGFPDHTSQAERAEMVGGFTAAAVAVVVAVHVEDILRGSG